MEAKYRRMETTVSFINYHIVFCPRYRRKIFSIPGVEGSFKELTRHECAKHDIEIIAMECHEDHVHMCISTYPQLSISDAVKCIKGATSHALRDEFPQLKKMPSLWTRSYFVSTAVNVSADTIKWYVETLKTRY